MLPTGEGSRPGGVHIFGQYSLGAHNKVSEGDASFQDWTSDSCTDRAVPGLLSMTKRV